MKKNLLLFLSVITTAVVLVSCKKDDETVAPVSTAAPGQYILSEGSFGGNNTKLGFYNSNTSSFTGDFFGQQNPSSGGLGDTGNDMIIYGGKLYIVMNISENVTVLDAETGKLIKKISFTGKQPRFAASARGKVYVTGWNNTVSVIDTSALNIVNTIPVGANPEGIAASANYLYVANSGGLNPVQDSTVSLIDLSTETEIRKIKVGRNPNKIEITSAGNVIVTAYGNFSTIPASVSVIDGSSNLVSSNLGPAYQYSHVRIYNNIAYFYNNYGGAGTAKVFNTATNSVIRNEFITDGTVIGVPYGINVNPANGDVYIADAVDYVSPGKIVCFNSAGVKKFSFSVAPGVNPNKILFK